MRLTAFFKLYKMCILLHRSKLNILAEVRYKNQQFSWNFSRMFANFAKSTKICQIFEKRDSARYSCRFLKMLKNAYYSTCKYWCRYSRNRAKFCWTFTDQGSSVSPLWSGKSSPSRDRALAPGGWGALAFGTTPPWCGSSRRRTA